MATKKTTSPIEYYIVADYALSDDYNKCSSLKEALKNVQDDRDIGEEVYVYHVKLVKRGKNLRTFVEEALSE